MREEEARKLREEKNRTAMERLGKGKWRLEGEEGLPVVDVD